MFLLLTPEQWIIVFLTVSNLVGVVIIPSVNEWRRWNNSKPERVAAIAKTTAETAASQASTAADMANAAGQMMENYKQNQAEMQADIDSLKDKAIEALSENSRQIAALKETFAGQQQSFTAETDDLKSQVAALKEQVASLLKVNTSLAEQLHTMTEHNIALELAGQMNKETNIKLAALRDQLNKLQATTEVVANGKGV